MLRNIRQRYSTTTMLTVVPLVVVISTALATYAAIYFSPPPKMMHETFSEYAKKYCSIESTAPRREDCYDRMVMKKAFYEFNGWDNPR